MQKASFICNVTHFPSGTRRLLQGSTLSNAGLPQACTRCSPARGASSRRTILNLASRSTAKQQSRNPNQLPRIINRRSRGDTPRRASQKSESSNCATLQLSMSSSRPKRGTSSRTGTIKVSHSLIKALVAAIIITIRDY